MMNIAAAIPSLCALAGRFRASDRGNVAIMFAVAALPLIGAVGAAVDYSRASGSRTSLQSALDSAALILSKEAQSLSSAQLSSRADAVVKANFHSPNVTDLSVTASLTSPQSGSYALTVSGTATVGTTLTGIWRPSVAIGATAEVLWGMKRLELALALDNTGSMASANKMTQLKIAAKDLLKTLQNAAKKPEDVKVSIIPFSTDVNVGTSNIAATWLRWTEWENDAGNFTCTKSRYKSESTCTSNGGKWELDDRSTWNGCVWDRDQSNDVNNAAATSSATRYSTHQATACPVTMMPLSNDWSALNTKIDSMQPTGNTNVTIGLQMAFQTLSPVTPFNAAAPQADLDKVIILLTDGDNTQNRWSTSRNTIDARTRLACTNVKAANIKLYTVRVIDGNASLLQQCATKTDMYYDVQNASQLSAVFSTIAQNLANLRLSK